MEKNANYATVGLTTLILTVATIVFIVWLGRLSIARDFDLYDVVFQGPVRGLSEGGEVHFNGIKVGEVTKIALDKVNPRNVIARVRVTEDVPIRGDSYATLEPQGITGLNYVQISPGTPTRPLLKDAASEHCEKLGRDCVPVLGSRRSAFSDLLEGGGTVLTQTIEALGQVKKVLSDKNVESFSSTLAEIHAVTAELNARKALIADAQQTLQRIDAAAQEVTLLVQSSRGIVDGDGKRAIRNVADAAEETAAAAKEARIMIARLQDPAANFATNGLPQVTAAVAQLQTAAEALERMVNEVQASPTGVLGKPPADDLKVPK